MSPRRPGRHGGRYRASPSYRRLLRDLRRPYGRASAEALDVLRHRLDLPEPAQGWLDEQAENGDWSPLAACVADRTDTDAEIAVLHAAIACLEARAALGETDQPLPPPPPGGGGVSSLHTTSVWTGWESLERKKGSCSRSPS